MPNQDSRIEDMITMDYVIAGLSARILFSGKVLLGRKVAFGIRKKAKKLSFQHNDANIINLECPLSHADSERSKLFIYFVPIQGLGVS